MMVPFTLSLFQASTHRKSQPVPRYNSPPVSQSIILKQTIIPANHQSENHTSAVIRAPRPVIHTSNQLASEEVLHLSSPLVSHIYSSFKVSSHSLIPPAAIELPFHSSTPTNTHLTSYSPPPSLNL